MPVTQTNVADVDFTIAEMRRMRKAGSRAFQVVQNPRKSLTHPDFDRLWATAEDLGMLAYIHVLFAPPAVHPSFANNGRGLETYVEMGFPDFSLPTQHFIASMVYDGVFARHPKLGLVLAECETAWLPKFLHDIDAKTSRVAFDRAPQENFYKLPLKPSEYVSRQVRVSPLTGYVDVGFEYYNLKQLFTLVPEHMLVYSSDYPHVEGRQDGRELLTRHLPENPATHESFFGQSIANLVELN